MRQRAEKKKAAHQLSKRVTTRETESPKALANKTIEDVYLRCPDNNSRGAADVHSRARVDVFQDRGTRKSAEQRNGRNAGATGLHCA